jgi:ribosomal protein L29
MARLKFKDLKNMTEEEREKLLSDLKLDLVKARAESTKSGSSKIKEIKRTIARILTLKNLKK